MAKLNVLQKGLMLLLSVVVGFLTWFVRLVSFIGDVTIWIFRTIIYNFLRIFKGFKFDLKRNLPRSLVKSFEKTIHHPVISTDKSFKVGLFTIFAFLIASWYATKDLPSPRQLETREVPQTTKIYDRSGELLFNVYTDQNRTLVPLSEIPENLILATIAIEDKDFYKHKGFDIYGIARAATKTVFAGDLQGGSTITQQLVKSVFLTPERTLNRKIKELYLAFRVEMAFSKDRILEMYLNQVPFGGTAWGVSAAAEQYFGKDLKDLTLAESALLAGLPVAPTYYSPYGQDTQRSKDRQRLVLKRMVEEGYISQEEADNAANEELNFNPDTTDIRAPHFVMFVREYLAEKYGETVAAQGGLKVTTTLDLKVQESAQTIVSETVDELASYRVGNGAALVTKPQTGEILAMVGSKDFFDSENDGNVNVTIANRQPGSSIKPINYAAGFANGLITPATIIMDVPTTFANVPRAYRPVNYDGKFHGAVQVRYALANSYNIPAVKVLGIVSVPEMIRVARAMGITTFQDESRYGLSLTLGGGEVKMTDMATAYGVFANEGVRVDLVPVLKVEDSSGEVLEEYKPRAGKRVLSPEVTFLISSILSDNGARAAAFGSSSLLNVSGKTVAVKTGTTDDKRDNWAIGYTPGFLVATWVGNNDNSPMLRVASGITGATPIWHDIMTDVLKDKVNESFKTPSGIIGKEICTTTGGLKNDSCSNRFEYFISGTEPTKDTFAKSKVWVDVTTGKVVEAGSPNAEEKEEVIVSDPYEKKDFCATCIRIEPSPSPAP